MLGLEVTATGLGFAVLSISCYLLLVTGADMDDDSNIASNQGFRNVSLGLPEWESERREALMSDDDFSIVDAMSASSSSALDNVTRVLDRAAARGRLAEAVEPNPLFVNLVSNWDVMSARWYGGVASKALCVRYAWVTSRAAIGGTPRAQRRSGSVMSARWFGGVASRVF